MITPTPMSLVRRLLAKLTVLSVTSCRLIVAGMFFSLVIVPRKWRLQVRVSHYKHYHMLGGLNLPNEQVNAKVGSFVIHTHLVAFEFWSWIFFCGKIFQRSFTPYLWSCFGTSNFFDDTKIHLKNHMWNPHPIGKNLPTTLGFPSSPRLRFSKMM